MSGIGGAAPGIWHAGFCGAHLFVLSSEIFFKLAEVWIDRDSGREDVDFSFDGDGARAFDSDDR
jgi:hypothetical protein